MQQKIYSRLKRWRSLRGLGLEEIDDRIVVRGLSAPQPTSGERLDLPDFPNLELRKVHEAQHLYFARWKNLHFIDCNLSDLAFFNGRFDNCIFENCSMKGIGFWKFRMTNCRFERCDLVDAVLGGNNFFSNTRGCRYENVVWDRCDLRINGGDSEVYRCCRFINNRMEKLTSGAVYENCVFEGRFYEIQFDGRRILSRLPPNRFKGCDFKRADLVECQFFGMPLDPSMFSDDPDYIWLWRGYDDYAEWVEKLDVRKYPGKDIYLEHMKDCGSPTFTRRSSMTSYWCEEELDWLVEISEKYRPS